MSRGAPSASHRKYSTLPLGPGQRARVTPRRRARSGPPPRRYARRPPAAGVTDHPAGAEPLAADLELRLHHEHEVGRPAARRHAAARSTRPSEMKERSRDHQVHRLADRSQREVPDVGPVDDGDPLVGAAATTRAGRSRRRPRSPRATPRRSSTSVKPPVLAPASRPAGPPRSGRRPNTSSAPASLWRAAADVSGLVVERRPDHDRGSPGRPGWRTWWRSRRRRHPARGDAARGLLPGARQPAADELGVEAAQPGHHSSTSASRSCSVRWTRSSTASRVSRGSRAPPGARRARRRRPGHRWPAARPGGAGLGHAPHATAPTRRRVERAHGVDHRLRIGGGPRRRPMRPRRRRGAGRPRRRPSRGRRPCRPRPRRRRRCTARCRRRPRVASGCATRSAPRSRPTRSGRTSGAAASSSEHARDPGEHEQPRDPRGAGALEVGVEPVADDERPAAAGARRRVPERPRAAACRPPRRDAGLPPRRRPPRATRCPAPGPCGVGTVRSRFVATQNRPARTARAPSARFASPAPARIPGRRPPGSSSMVATGTSPSAVRASYRPAPPDHEHLRPAGQPLREDPGGELSGRDDVALVGRTPRTQLLRDDARRT